MPKSPCAPRTVCALAEGQGRPLRGVPWCRFELYGESRNASWVPSSAVFGNCQGLLGRSGLTRVSEGLYWAAFDGSHGPSWPFGPSRSPYVGVMFSCAVLAVRGGHREARLCAVLGRLGRFGVSRLWMPGSLCSLRLPSRPSPPHSWFWGHFQSVSSVTPSFLFSPSFIIPPSLHSSLLYPSLLYPSLPHPSLLHPSSSILPSPSPPPSSLVRGRRDTPAQFGNIRGRWGAPAQCGYVLLGTERVTLPGPGARARGQGGE